MASAHSPYDTVYSTQDETRAKLHASVKLSRSIQDRITQIYAGFVHERLERVVLLIFKNNTQVQFPEQQLDDPDLEARLWLIEGTHKRWWWDSQKHKWETDEYDTRRQG